jgi:uncharacterized OsmC-like protein
MATQVRLNGLDLQGLKDFGAALTSDPERRKTVWRSRVRWQGGFQNTAESREHAPVRVDEPTALGGSDTAPNPAELLLDAVGTCLSIGYVLNAAARGIELKGLELDVEGDIDLGVFAGVVEDGNPGYSQIRVRAHIDSDAAPEALQALHDHVVRTSPVCNTVARPVAVTTELATR